MDGQNSNKFWIPIIIDKIYDLYVAIVRCHSRKFAKKFRPLIDVRNWFLLNILRMDGQSLTNFFIHSFLYLQVMMTCMRAQKSLKFGLIGPTAELAALERLIGL